MVGMTILMFERMFSRLTSMMSAKRSDTDTMHLRAITQNRRQVYKINPFLVPFSLNL